MSNSVPEGWKESTIGEITATDSLFCDGDWVESKDQDQAGLNRLIQLADVGDGVFVNKSSRYMNDEQFDRLKCTALKRNDILIARMPDPLGRACLYPFETGRAATVVDVAVIRTPHADHYWLMSAINSSEFRYQIDLNASGTTRTRIARGVLSQIKILQPPLPEQQKIAAILSSVDDVIEKTRAQIDKLKDLKTGMMQELLTKGIGSGGGSHTEFKESPVGWIPACWEVCKADDISHSIMVGVVIKPTQYYVDQGVPALRSANVRENGLTMDNLKYFSPESNDQLHKSKLRKGDLLTVRTGYPGTTAVVTDEFEGCNCIDVVITRPSAEMDSDFFCLWVNSDHGKGQVLKAQGGLAQQHFNVGDMKNLLVPVPPLEEQRDIFRAVDSVIKKLSTSEKRLARLNSLKKALMQDLLTGKVRVNVSEKETAVA